MTEPIEVVEAKAVEEMPQFTEWFIPIWRTGNSPWFCLSMYRTAIEAEGATQNFVAGAKERKIVRVVLPN